MNMTSRREFLKGVAKVSAGVTAVSVLNPLVTAFAEGETPATAESTCAIIPSRLVEVEASEGHKKTVGYRYFDYTTSGTTCSKRITFAITDGAAGTVWEKLDIALNELKPTTPNLTGCFLDDFFVEKSLNQKVEDLKIISDRVFRWFSIPTRTVSGPSSNRNSSFATRRVSGSGKVPISPRWPTTCAGAAISSVRTRIFCSVFTCGISPSALRFPQNGWSGSSSTRAVFSPTAR